MKKEISLTYEFVEFIPDDLKERTIYVSVKFATVLHKCCCGCGQEVVTPLSPTDWKLIFDGKTITLYPSIGNWSLECQSHYWIENNRVRWAAQWSKDEIDSGRTYDRLVKERYFNTNNDIPVKEGSGKVSGGKREKEPWQWLREWWSSRHR
jgi:hypothetical protein